MDSLTRSINFELPRDLHFDKYAHQVLENSSKSSPVAEAVSTPTITTFDALANSDFLQKVGASILNSIQIKHKFVDTTNTNNLIVASDLQQHTTNSIATQAAAAGGAAAMDLDFAPNHVIIDSSSFNAMDELQKQLEYDKFMNEVWIGIVFTLILISMIFCICSCFLYHQFRTWKRNYHSSTAQCSSNVNDMEALKYQSDFEDPVPEYTLVSGLPSYEAALELLHKTPKSCLIVYPSVFNVFNKHEKANDEQLLTTAAATTSTPTLQQQNTLTELTMPLLGTPATTTTMETANTTNLTPTQEAFKSNFIPIPSYAEAMMSYKTINEKIPTAAATTTTTTAVVATTTTGIICPVPLTEGTRNKSETSLLTLTHKNQNKC